MLSADEVEWPKTLSVELEDILCKNDYYMNKCSHGNSNSSVLGCNYFPAFLLEIISTSDEKCDFPIYRENIWAGAVSKVIRCNFYKRLKL